MGDGVNEDLVVEQFKYHQVRKISDERPPYQRVGR